MLTSLNVYCVLGIFLSSEHVLSHLMLPKSPQYNYYLQVAKGKTQAAGMLLK